MKQFCFVLIGAALAFGSVARAALVSGISVVVNEDVITYGEIADKVERPMAMIASLYASDRMRFEDEARKVRDQQIEDLVERQLIIHDFTSSGYATNVLESFIDDQINKTIQKEYYGDRARLIKTLQAQGLTFEMYRKQQRENFIVGYMSYQNLDENKKILISPLKIEQYYNAHLAEFKVEDQVKLRMIAINQPEDAAPGTARRTAQEVLEKINNGVPFAEMAMERSQDSYTKEGGERGWVARKDLKSELADTAFALKPGQHSGIVELPEACYIMLVEDIRSAHVSPLKEVRDEIERTLKSEEKTRLHRRWIERLKKKSFINYY